MQEQQEQQGHAFPHRDMYYDAAELAKLKYVKITYIDFEEEMHEVSAEVKFIGNTLISLYFKNSKNLYVECPQDVILKFITQDAMYIATALLHEIKQSGDKTYFSVIPPKKMVRQQNRKYSRVILDRPCVLVMNDDKGFSTTFLSKTVNISASGILIEDLKTIVNDIPYNEEFSKYDCFHLVVFFEPGFALKLFARYVRHEFVNESHRYAFHFMSVKPEITDRLFRYITGEQIKQLKLANNS